MIVMWTKNSAIMLKWERGHRSQTLQMLTIYKWHSKSLGVVRDSRSKIAAILNMYYFCQTPAPTGLRIEPSIQDKIMRCLCLYLVIRRIKAITNFWRLALSSWHFCFFAWIKFTAVNVDLDGCSNISIEEKSLCVTLLTSKATNSCL